MNLPLNASLCHSLLRARPLPHLAIRFPPGREPKLETHPPFLFLNFAKIFGIANV